MFVLEAPIDPSRTGEGSSVGIVEEIKTLMTIPEFLAFSHKNFNRDSSVTHITTLWQTEAAATSWGQAHSTMGFTVTALEDSNYTREDFLSEVSMQPIKSGMLQN